MEVKFGEWVIFISQVAILMKSINEVLFNFIRVCGHLHFIMDSVNIQNIKFDNINILLI